MAEVKHHTEATIIKALHRLIAESSTCRVAVGFCGEHAYQFFPEAPALRPADLRIVVDASNTSVSHGLTNPKGLKHLLGLTSQLRSLKGLHAKVFIFDNTAAIVGSVNLSKSSIEQQYQMSLEVSDVNVIGELITWFDNAIWANGDTIDPARLKQLNDLWPGSEFHGPTEAKRAKLPKWRGEAPHPSDFSIGLAAHTFAELLKQFRENECNYSRSGETCEQMSLQVESNYRKKSEEFRGLMARRDSWTRDDLSQLFDLAHTNGKAAKMRKPRFVSLPPETVARSLTFLMEGAGDPYIRFEKLLASGSTYKLDGLGESGLIFLLHLWKPDEFPVINGPVESALEVLKVKIPESRQRGQIYKNRTAAIREVVRRTGLKTFARVDHFLDAIGKKHIGPVVSN